MLRVVLYSAVGMVFFGSSIFSMQPGSLEFYSERLKACVDIANSFEEVRRAQAGQRGFRIEVLAQGSRLSDGAADILALKIGCKIKKEIDLSGSTLEVKIICDSLEEQR